MALIRLVSSETMAQKPSIIEQINDYAKKSGLIKKNGAFLKNGLFYGSFLDVGREAGIDLQDGK